MDAVQRRKKTVPASLGRFIGILGAQERRRRAEHWKDRRVGLS